MQTRSFSIVLLLIFMVSPALAQDRATLPIEVDVDHAAFAYDGGQSLVEVYLAFGAEGLHYEREGNGGFAAQLPIKVKLRPHEETAPAASEGPAWADSLALNFSVQDTSTLEPGHHFLHQMRTTVPPGRYELVLEIPEQEETNRRTLTVRRSVEVPDYSTDRGAHLSSITLASSIQVTQEAQRQSLFHKNGLVIRPNPRRVYGRGVNQIFYYAEAYRVGRLAGSDNAYTVRAYVSRANQEQPVAGLEQETTRKARSPDVLVGSFDLSKLPSGSYFLHLALLGEHGTTAAEQQRKFYVYNPQVEEEAPAAAFDRSYETSPYASMPEEAVNAELRQVRLIAGGQERDDMDGLEGLDEKRRYLMSFWQNRDPQPQTRVNEYRRRFKQRVHFANQRYGSSFEEGWETDRGRTLIKYGQPADMQPHLYDQDKIPHEIWRYDNIPGEGQVVFVFADRDGFGRFELLHTNITGGRHMPNWRDVLTRQ